MTARWTIWTVGIALLALLLMMPLRAALSEDDLAQLRLTARQVAGSVWRGRIGDLTLDRQLIGTFDVRLDPAALLLGQVEMQFTRIGSLQGDLTGTLRAGGATRGIESTSGRIPTASLFAPLPLESLDLDRATILFRNGSCVEASGWATARVGVKAAGLDLTRGLTGPLECDGERVRARLSSASGGERVEFYISSAGRVRGWLTIRDASPEMAAVLAFYGFKAGPDGLTLSANGQL